MTRTAIPRDLIAESRSSFLGETSAHVMDIWLDRGIYRHVRFKNPDTMTYYFDLVTWPGHLAIAGDCGTFVFSRVRDMFEFFDGNMDDERHGINPGYWSEKLQAPDPRAAERFSPAALRARLSEWVDGQANERPEGSASLRRAVSDLLDDDRVEYEHEAQHLLLEFEHNGIRIHDAWEWNLREWDWRFLWCCWAIVWGIRRYKAARS